ASLRMDERRHVFLARFTWIKRIHWGVSDFKGSFAVAAAFTAIAVIGLLITAIVFARAMQSLFSGPLAESCSAFPDLLRKEKLVVVPVTLLMFVIGIAPQFMFNIFNTTVVQMSRLLN